MFEPNPLHPKMQEEEYIPGLWPSQEVKKILEHFEERKPKDSMDMRPGYYRDSWRYEATTKEDETNNEHDPAKKFFEEQRKKEQEELEKNRIHAPTEMDETDETPIQVEDESELTITPEHSHEELSSPNEPVNTDGLPITLLAERSQKREREKRGQWR
ncbi:MAG: hypothetical protein ACR2PX_12105 [Endozoicomonas sp.]|uniref:hypothetical protein n=1 Tax=Endozoicomonas sp. TaxID=1892382 RepID=UPI003D9B4821